jgi:hypothetical protein
VATVGCVVLTWASPAMAKGPDQATITGPSLDQPIVLEGYGEPGGGGDLVDLAEGGGLFAAMFGPGGSPGRLQSEAPTADLGPKFEIAFRVPAGDLGSTIRQDLYPQASGGPVTFTAAGQPVFDKTTLGGWYTGSTRFRAVLVNLGVAASAIVAPQVGPAAAPGEPAAPAPAPAGRAMPIVPIAAAVLGGLVVLGGALFAWRRRSAGRPRALPSRPATTP